MYVRFGAEGAAHLVAQKLLDLSANLSGRCKRGAVFKLVVDGISPLGIVNLVLEMT